MHRLLNSSPPWLVSSLIHAAALVALSLMTLAVQEAERKGVSVVAAPVEETALEQLEEIELQPQEELDIEQFNLAVTNPDPGMIQFADLTAATAEMAANDAGDISLSNTTVGEIGELFGESGQGMAKIGEGMRAAYFFGAKSTGSRFVFVVDNSNSMGGGRFETALNELVKTVEGLGPRQKFYVIFFSDTAYRMFHPTPVDGLVAATPENKAKLRRWLYTVQMCLRTRGLEAMQAALQLNPDAIYILGDGAFTDKTGKMLTAPHNRKTVIHTVGMEVQQRGANELTAIAKANKGTFRLVAASPAAKAMARQNPIKRNNTRGPVWGIDLPLVRRK
jgi:cell division septation protein DedD